MGPESKHLKTLNLFAYETIANYKQNAAQYLPLKPTQVHKLELITIADMASKQAVVPYDALMQVLDIADIRQLEDKIIECMINDLLKGRLNQKNRSLHVQSTFGRDVQDSAIDDILAKLQNQSHATFVFTDFGSMAVVGPLFAVADLRGIKMSGALGWLIWGLAHLAFIPDNENRITLLTKWLWMIVTRERSALVITKAHS